VLSSAFVKGKDAGATVEDGLSIQIWRQPNTSSTISCDNRPRLPVRERLADRLQPRLRTRHRLGYSRRHTGIDLAVPPGARGDSWLETQRCPEGLSPTCKLVGPLSVPRIDAGHDVGGCNFPDRAPWRPQHYQLVGFGKAQGSQDQPIDG
jgi:hypothetical protein